MDLKNIGITEDQFKILKKLTLTKEDRENLYKLLHKESGLEKIIEEKENFLEEKLKIALINYHITPEKYELFKKVPRLFTSTFGCRCRDSFWRYNGFLLGSFLDDKWTINSLSNFPNDAWSVEGYNKEVNFKVETGVSCLDLTNSKLPLKIDNYEKTKEFMSIVKSADPTLFLELKEAYYDYLVSKYNSENFLTDKVKIVSTSKWNYSGYKDYFVNIGTWGRLYNINKDWFCKLYQERKENLIKYRNIYSGLEEKYSNKTKEEKLLELKIILEG